MMYYEYFGLHDKIEEDSNINYDEVKVAPMNEWVKADEKHPILGTYALATCLGLIISDKENTYLMHITISKKELTKDIITSLKDHPQVLIIPGFYTEIAMVNELEAYLLNLNPELTVRTLNLSEFRNEEYESIEFFYDTRNKSFVKGDFSQIIGKGR